MNRSARVALSVVAGAAMLVLGSHGARATPSLWAMARDPALGDRELVIARVDAFFDKWRESHDLGLEYLVHARELLDEVDAEHAQDWRLRIRLAETLEHLAGDFARGRGVVSREDKPKLERAVSLYVSVANSEATPAPFREDAWSRLGIAYVRLERPMEEIHAYDQALALETEPPARALLLANRAEVEMMIGDLTSAVAGYRAALSEIASAPPILVMSYAPTTLWGLAVALDRAGDLKAGIDTIALARSYDPGDERIKDSGWVYVPEYDEAWYTALGAWSAARHDRLDAARAESYGLAVAKWEDYLARAKPSDPYIAIARLHLDACVKERDDFTRRVRGAPPPLRTREPHKDSRTRQEKFDALKREAEAVEKELARKARRSVP